MRVGVQLCGLGHGYRADAPVFAGVDLVIPGDRRVAILGGAGSGKTTLLQIIAGLIAPQTGTVVRDCRLSFPAGYQRGFRIAATARQNIGFAARIYDADPAEVERFVARVTGLGDLLDRPMRELSVQERLTTSYALAYAIPFDTYLFDNGIATGSPAFRDRCQAMFEARSRHAGAIVATRHMRVAEQLCDCAVLIRNGSAEFFDDLGEALAFCEGAGASGDRADESMVADGQP